MLSTYGKAAFCSQLDSDWSALEHLHLADLLPDDPDVTPLEVEQFAREAVRSATLHSTRQRCGKAEVIKSLTPARVVALLAVLQFLDEEDRGAEASN